MENKLWKKRLLAIPAADCPRLGELEAIQNWPARRLFPMLTPNLHNRPAFVICSDYDCQQMLTKFYSCWRKRSSLDAMVFFHPLQGGSHEARHTPHTRLE